MRLFEPGSIGKLAVKNRIVMAAMGIGALADSGGQLSQRGIDYYVARAKGGTGLIITGAARFRQIEQSPCSPLTNRMVISDRLCLGRLSELADAIHDYGAKIAVQLMVGHGRLVGGEVLRRGDPVAPSTLPCFFNPNILARELRAEEIERIIADYGFAAEVVRAAGIDAIEINNHNGYLPDQFLTSLWNQRKDKYGGELEGRFTFLREVITSVRKGAGDDFPIIVRFGLTHYLPGGREIEEGLEIARRLEALGVSALDIDAGCYETSYWAKPTTYSPEGTLVGLAEMVKKTVNIPVITAGKLGNPQLAESVLQEGKADFIALGRPLLADPEWPKKVKERRFEDIRPCIGDHEGCSGRNAEGKYISCVVNPATGMEKELTIKRAERRRLVLVIGGGPGGMEAARVAALRGHEVALWERIDALGGNLLPASVPDFKRDYGSLVTYFTTQMKKSKVDVHLNKEANPQSIREMNPDVVIVATGSMPIIPDIPGVNSDNVIPAIDLLMGRRKTGQSVVIIGGGIVGCETALYLGHMGKKTTVVEILSTVARDMYFTNRMHLLKLLNDAGVRILCSTYVSDILDKGVIVRDQNGKESRLESDTIVLSVGYKSNQNLLASLIDDAQEVYAIGDCVEPRKVMNAVWEGFRTARLI